MVYMLISLFFGVLGAMTGSLVGVIAERMHTGQSFVTGRSKCNSCARTLTFLDLIPVVSFIASRGVCRTCKAQVPGLYAILELTLGILFMLAYQKLGITLSLFIILPLLALLACIVLYDIRHTIVIPRLSLLLALLAVGYAGATYTLESFGLALVVSGIVGMFFLSLHVFSKGKAMGLGDAPIAFSLSLIAYPYAFSGLLFSFWLGALYGIGVLFLRRHGPKMGIEVPFVPFLALGFLLAYFTGWDPLALSFGIL